jgi:hypothetical protein
MVPINGGMAKYIFPIGSGKMRLEKYARIIMLKPIARAIWIWGDLSNCLKLFIDAPLKNILIDDKIEWEL